MGLPSVSIILTCANRPQALHNSLIGWANLDYPDFQFSIVDNGTGNPKIEEVAQSFKAKLPITFYKEEKRTAVNILWNKYGVASQSEYIVYSMMDEIISHGTVLQMMVELSEPDGLRTSISTSFMDGDITASLDTRTDWHKNPSILPTSWGPPENQKGAGILSHIHGNFKKNWEWFGWFCDLDIGHLWLEQDVHIRERCLDKLALTPKGVWCYHQFHHREGTADEARPGFIYRTEREARRLDKAERER